MNDILYSWRRAYHLGESKAIRRVNVLRYGLALFAGLFPLIFSGCAVALTQPPAPPQGAQKVFATYDIVNMVRQGMTAQDVRKLLPESIVIGFEVLQAGGQPKPITVPNPYKKDQWQSERRQWSADYYLTHIARADGVITDDELMPVVFLDEKVAGKGWEYLNQTKKKYPPQ